MNIKEIQEKSLLKKITRKDTLFHGDFTLDPYQNCAFGCPYCDSSFDPIIYIKQNALSLLKEEMKDKKNKRIIIGSVHDPYQPIEQTMKLTRNILSFLLSNQQPIHILTKSSRILQDLDILTQFNDMLVTISIPFIDTTHASIFEPNVENPLHRMSLVSKLKKNHIKTGIAAIPIIPYISDSDETLNTLFKTAKTNSASYLLCKPLFLKGDQKYKMFELIKNEFPKVFPRFKKEYSTTIEPSNTYQINLKNKIQTIATLYQILLQI